MAMGRVPVVLILTILGTAVAVRARAGVLVVNPAVKSADDANPGTEEKPFRTISAAAAVAEAGDTVLIHGGIYRESVMIAHSGTADRPIRFVTATGESVVVTGADRLTRWR
jgi:hypothetical protein